MSDTKSECETRACVDCGEVVAKWFTSHGDKGPRCEPCATADFKERCPLTWGIIIKRSTDIECGP